MIIATIISTGVLKEWLRHEKHTDAVPHNDVAPGSELECRKQPVVLLALMRQTSLVWCELREVLNGIVAHSISADYFCQIAEDTKDERRADDTTDCPDQHFVHLRCAGEVDCALNVTALATRQPVCSIVAGASAEVDRVATR